MPLTIEPNAVYDDEALVLALGITFQSMARARREGLRYTRAGRRVLYRGQWLIDWLERAAQCAEQQGASSVGAGTARARAGTSPRRQGG